MLLEEILASAQEGAAIGSAIGGLFDSAHVDDFNKGVEAYNQIDWDNPDEKDVKAALEHFNKVNDDDQLFLQCLSWYNKAYLFAAQHKWSVSYSMLSNISKAETDFFTMKKDTIKEIKGWVYQARKDIQAWEQAWKEEQERIRREEEERKRREEEERRRREEEERRRREEEDRRKKEEEERRIREEEQRRRDQEDIKRMLTETKQQLQVAPAQQKSVIPVWAYIIMGVLLIAVTVLVCYIIFKK